METNPAKIRQLRFDTLSMMMNLANVCPGGKFLVIDEVSGLLLSSILLKTKNKGLALALHSGDCVTYDILRPLGINPETRTDLFILPWSRLEVQPDEGVN